MWLNLLVFNVCVLNKSWHFKTGSRKRFEIASATKDDFVTGYSQSTFLCRPDSVTLYSGCACT
jgi:hypothetical protein